jgi:NADH-quinone oxidoreductase subunit A
MARSVSRSAAIPLTLWGAAATLRALFLVVLRGVSASYARCPTRRGRGEALLAEFVGILLILVVALLVAGLLGGLHKLLGPRRDFPEKLEPFECGERQIVSPKQRFSVKFYLVAMLFVLFDLEAVFFYPWGALFRELGMYGLAVMSVFTVPLVIGLLYEWRKGALEW